ncbi:MAG: alpha-L-rhamnosidase C-terminal domain-containing protein [Lachnotalea sp.]
MWKEAKWIGVAKEEIADKKIYEGDMNGRFAYFVTAVNVPEGGKLSIDITANSRYRLWINGKPVLSGPCKGDIYRHYYETLDVSNYLITGENILAAQVLCCDPDSTMDQYDERASIFGVYSPGGGHRLAVEGDVLSAFGEEMGTVTTGIADWRVWLDHTFYLISDQITIYLGAIKEKISFDKSPSHWKEAVNLDWRKASLMGNVLESDLMKIVGIVPKFPLQERDIPLLYEKLDTFPIEMTKTGIIQQGKLTIPSGKGAEIILDAGVIKNGYPQYEFIGGKERKVSITYFEKFVKEGEDIRRSDMENGTVVGLMDEIVLGEGGSLRYEPFWYRTFRFVRIQVEVGDSEVTVKAPVFFKTGYPLPIESNVESSAEWVNQVYEICVRTLENCMVETYMDCPFYEQLQYPMDTRLQILFNYAVSRDIGLVKKAIKDFHNGILPFGLLPGKSPTSYLQVISTFSLHYIMILQEYYQQTGDEELLKEYQPDVDRILGYYDRKIGSDGLLGSLGYWEFVDWQKEWEKTGGRPLASLSGPSTIINLMYAYTLLQGAKIYKATGRAGIAQEYLERREKILTLIQKLCWDEAAGMYREGPDFLQFSQHAQSWAVLNGMNGEEEGWRKVENRSGMKRIMTATISKDAPLPGCEPIIQVSFATAYEFFRAMEIAGMYQETEESLMHWAHLIDLDCTCCPEVPELARSECHAWSALPIFEMLRSMAGITGEDAGWEHVRVMPHLDYVPDLKGRAATPRGMIIFDYKKVNGTWEYELIMPDGLTGMFVLGNGQEIRLNEGKNMIKESSLV